jgi:hypothetical protein
MEPDMAKRSRKSTLAQQVVDVAATGVGAPKPVKRWLTTRWGARLAFVGAVALFVSGVVTVQWSGYSPHLSVNRQRAKEVKDAIAQRVEAIKIEKADRRDAPDAPANY